MSRQPTSAGGGRDYRLLARVAGQGIPLGQNGGGFPLEALFLRRELRLAQMVLIRRQLLQLVDQVLRSSVQVRRIFRSDLQGVPFLAGDRQVKQRTAKSCDQDQNSRNPLGRAHCSSSERIRAMNSSSVFLALGRGAGSFVTPCTGRRRTTRTMIAPPTTSSATGPSHTSQLIPCALGCSKTHSPYR